MKRIPLLARDGTVRAHALVDDDDFKRLGHHRWRLTTRGYVERSPHILLHREILGLRPRDGLKGDHRDGDPLNNRRANLRVTDNAGNLANQWGPHERPGRTSRHRGVSRRSETGRWRAYARVRGWMHHLGCYDTEDEAAAVAASFRWQHMPTSDMDRAAPYREPVHENRGVKLTREDVLSIRASAESNAALARRYDVDPANISHIRRGVTWRNVGV